MTRPCECCQRASVAPNYPQHDPACLWCGARYWRNVQDFRSGARLAAWREHILATWEAIGHNRDELVKLARANKVLQPKGR